MNINDVEEQSTEEVPSDLIGAIFSRQASLMEKYHQIEKDNGFHYNGPIPVNLHDKFGQAKLKDFAWRMTEEFTEATDSLLLNDGQDHYLEELIDGLHFLVELFILAGYKPEGSMEDWFNADLGPSVQPYQVIERVGCAMNCLKNKPWKVTQMLTDIPRFYAELEQAWIMFIGLMKTENVDPIGVYQLYFRKSTVNQFRQRSKY